MDYEKYLNKSKEKYKELDRIKKDAEFMESTMIKPKIKHIDSDMQDTENINQNSNTQDNNFIYKTQGAQSIGELRRQLQEILGALINQEFINKETGLVATIKKMTSIRFQVKKRMKNLYENAALKTTHSDSKERPNVSNVHRFNNNIEANKKETTVKITLFERIDGPNRIYSLELQVAPPPNNLSVQEIGMAKSLSSEPSAHTNSPNIANFDNETIPQNSNECQEQNDSNSVSNEFNENISKKRRV